MSSYDAIDALIYLQDSIPLEVAADYIAEEFDVGNVPEHVADFVISAIHTALATIDEELAAVHDGRTSFSTGMPFRRTQLAPRAEIADDGVEVPVIAEYVVPQHPAHMVGPFDGGVWKDEVTA